MALGVSDEEGARDAREAGQGDAPEPMQECEGAGEQEEGGNAEEEETATHEGDATDAGSGAQDEAPELLQEYDEAGGQEQEEDEEGGGEEYPEEQEEGAQEAGEAAMDDEPEMPLERGQAGEQEYDGDAEPAEEEWCMDEEEYSSHLPFLPSSESELPEDTSTVDPCHIISLIRKLIPQDSNAEKELSAKQGFPEDRNASSNDGESTQTEIKNPWEESGCVLWDLSACEPQAEVMMNNLILEVLLENLRWTQSPRVKEICLGIMGNLACHASLVNSIISHDGLIATVVDQLLLNDAACLSETFRLLSTILRSSTFVDWVEDLSSDVILLRIIWIIGNTINYTLIKAVINFLSTAVDDQTVTNMLIEPLIKQGLVDHVISLLAIEMQKLLDESKLDRPVSLGFILHFFEELCSIKSCSEVMLSSDQLIKVLYDMIKLTDKFEVANYCTSVVVILDNLLSDGKHLSPTLSHDLPLLEGLFDILPLVSDAHEVRSALWSILARFLAQAQKVDMNLSSLDEFVSLFLRRFILIKNDLEGHGLDKEENLSEEDDDLKHGISTSLRVIGTIMERWITEKNSQGAEETPLAGNSIENARELLSYCRKFNL